MKLKGAKPGLGPPPVGFRRMRGISVGQSRGIKARSRDSLTEAEGQDACLTSLRRALRAEGHVVMATFGPNGPEQCSGLQIKRYDAERLARRFGDDFALVQSMEKTHTTPWGKVQDFTYCVLQFKE